MQNRPCHLPAAVIDEDVPGAGRRFKAAAAGRRGVTAWIEREGILVVGDAVRLHIPDQMPWNGGCAGSDEVPGTKRAAADVRS